MVNFLNLPTVQAPRNALVDLSPIGNAIDGNRRNALMVQEGQRQDQQMAMQRENQQYQRGRDQKQDSQSLVDRLGKMAIAGDTIQDPAQRAAFLDRILKEHPDGASLGPEYRDPSRAFKLIAAEAGQFREAEKPEYRSVGDSLLKIGPNGSATPIYTKPPEADPIRDMLAERLRSGSRSGQPQTAPQPPAPILQPQSYQGGPGMPGLQLVADQQTAAPQAPAPQEDTIDTLFGPMTRDQARDLAGPMMLDPKYATAGKALLDSIGGTGAAGMSKPAETKLDEGTISAANTLGRIREIRLQYKPKFATIPGKLEMYGASWGAALTGKLNPEMTKELTDFSKYKVAAFNNFNQLLKELSGTAVSAQELTRQQIVQPNPGEGIFDGDDPVTLEAKMDQGEKIARSAIARMNFMRSRGLQFNKDTAEQFMRLEDVPNAIEKRGSEIEQQLRQANPQASPQSLEQETAKRLKQEFGI